MAANLKTRAIAQRDNAIAAENAARARLDDAQQRRRATADAAAVPLEQWRDQMGWQQYLVETIARDQALRDAETSIRARLAAIPTPANHAALVAELADNLRDQATARVMRRDAYELDMIAAAELSQLGAAAAAAAADRATAEAWVTEAEALQAAIEADKAAAAAAPVSGVRAAAAAVAAGATYTAARDRLAALLPAPLAARAAARFGEAHEVTAANARVADAAQSDRDQLERTRNPVDADVAIATRALAAAHGALRRYVAGAPGQLGQASALLAGVVALPALSSDEQAALDPAVPERQDAVDAVALEQTFAEKWRAFADKDADVRIAILGALADDPDADPLGAPAVTAATAVRDGAAVAGELGIASSAYTTASQTALDEWEREVPGWLWDGARDFAEAARLLDELADAATLGDVLAALDAAIDQIADARDEQAVLRRAALLLGSAVELEAARIEALALSAPEREMAYVRGDGRGGRHADES